MQPLAPRGQAEPRNRSIPSVQKKNRDDSDLETSSQSAQQSVRLAIQGNCCRGALPLFQSLSDEKTPKLYFYDVGLVSYLLGWRQTDDLEDRAIIGSLFENLVIADILKKNHHRYLLRDYWFWRAFHGHEVDLLTKSGGGFEIFEIKSTQTILPKLFKGLDYFSGLAKGQVKACTLV